MILKPGKLRVAIGHRLQQLFVSHGHWLTIQSTDEASATFCDTLLVRLRYLLKVFKVAIVPLVVRGRIACPAALLAACINIYAVFLFLYRRALF